MLYRTIKVHMTSFFFRQILVAYIVFNILEEFGSNPVNISTEFFHLNRCHRLNFFYRHFARPDHQITNLVTSHGV